MSVENGVVISGFQKDYELLSWNKQGEITHFEGILTIVFLVVSPCSHIDNWKQLYCVIKIPYSVKMSLKYMEDISDEAIYDSIWDEIAPIKKQYVEKLELENYELKLERNELIKHIEIEREEINNLKQKIEEIENKLNSLSEEKKKIKPKFDSPELLSKYFKEILGKEYYNYSRIDTIIKFIFENINKEFNRDDIGNYCKKIHNKKPCDATIHKHLNLLINHKIIKRKYHGIYEVIKL